MDNTEHTSQTEQRKRISRKSKPCAVSGCPGIVRSKNVCRSHYNRFYVDKELRRKKAREYIASIRSDPERYEKYKQKIQGYQNRLKETNPEKYERNRIKARERFKERLKNDPELRKKYNELNNKRTKECFRKQQALRDERTAILIQLSPEELWKEIGYVPGEKKNEIPSESNGH